MQRNPDVVAIDLPTSWMMSAKANDEFTGRIFEAINGILLDMLSAVAPKDYDDRRCRQAQEKVKAKAKAAGLYKCCAEEVERNAGIGKMIIAGRSWTTTGCSRAPIVKIAKRVAVA
jgi:hypothetical protein